jgi:hypothetical protein
MPSKSKNKRRPPRTRGRPAQARVLLQRPHNVDDVGVRTTRSEGGNWDRSAAEWVRGYLNPRRIHPVVRLTEDGIDWGTAPRTGDEIGYAMDPYRLDTCFQAAIATCVQAPIEQVPDLALDRRLDDGEDPVEINRDSWARIDRWATNRGFAMRLHLTVPLQRHRWIGVTVWDGDRSTARTPFQDHCLVMTDDRVVFDPSCSVRLPAGKRLLRSDPSQISYGITFDEMED